MGPSIVMLWPLLAACAPPLSEETEEPAAHAGAKDVPADVQKAEPPAAPDDEAHGGYGTDGRVFFISPKDGDTVKSPVHIQFGLEGMSVKPAGEPTEGTGHHHLIIGPAGVASGDVVPADETHIHFGKGDTETDVELKPGEHKITMQFADGLHRSFGQNMATTITITVEP
jgi:hypothetical protein